MVRTLNSTTQRQWKNSKGCNQQVAACIIKWLFLIAPIEYNNDVEGGSLAKKIVQASKAERECLFELKKLIPNR